MDNGVSTIGQPIRVHAGNIIGKRIRIQLHNTAGLISSEGWIESSWLVPSFRIHELSDECLLPRLQLLIGALRWSSMIAEFTTTDAWWTIGSEIV